MLPFLWKSRVFAGRQWRFQNPLSPLPIGKQLLCSPQQKRLPKTLVGIICQISSTAVYLLAMRVLSAIGFLIALWLCPIHVFANLGIYLASLSLAALAVFGRFEILIVGGQDESQSANATRLCVIVAVSVIGATLFFGLVVLRPFVPAQYAVLFACALFARAWLRLGLAFATRYGRYERAVKVMLPHTIGQPLTLLLLIRDGYDPLFAFVLSDIVGHAIAAVCVSLSEWRAFYANFQPKARYGAIWLMTKTNFRLPTVNLTAAASAFLFAITPLFLLPTLTNGILAGTLALLFRILDLPTSLTTASLSPILMKEIVDRRREGTLRTMRSMFLLPAFIAIAVFGAIALGGVTLKNLHVAPSWTLALTILPVVALFQASIAATSPLIDMATLAGRQKGLMMFNVVAVALAASALTIWNDKPVFAILLAGAIGFSRVVAISVWLLGFKRWERHFEPEPRVRLS